MHVCLILSVHPTTLQKALKFCSNALPAENLDLCCQCVSSFHVKLSKLNGRCQLSRHTIEYGWNRTHFSHWTVLQNLYSNLSWSQPSPVDCPKWPTTKQLAHVTCAFFNVLHCVCNQPCRNPNAMQSYFHISKVRLPALTKWTVYGTARNTRRWTRGT